jgi:hypothetical protein
MNAVAEVTNEDDQDERIERRMDGRERSWLECRLQIWGDWHEQNDDYQGFPRASSISMFLDGFGGGSFGSRCLLVPRPEDVRWVDIRVLRLPDHEQLAVWAHYVPWVQEDGRIWSPESKARLLGISWAAYRQRLTRARFRILELNVTL